MSSLCPIGTQDTPLRACDTSLESSRQMKLIREKKFRFARTACPPRAKMCPNHYIGDPTSDDNLATCTNKISFPSRQMKLSDVKKSRFARAPRSPRSKMFPTHYIGDLKLTILENIHLGIDRQTDGRDYNIDVVF